MRPIYRKAAFIVIYRRDKSKILYLLLKRKLHWKGWEFPKGGVKKNEAVLKAVQREIKEETGQKPLNIKKYPIQGKYKYLKKLEDRSNIIGQTYQLFSAQIKNKKIKIDKLEHSSYKWLEFKKTVKLLTYSNQRKCLRIIHRKLNS